MEEQPSQTEPEKLLEELRSDSAIRRELAANKIAEQKLASDGIAEILNRLASSDSSESVRQAAAIALIQLGMKPPEGTGVVGAPKPKAPPLTQREKRRDFLIGFFGWWIINLVAFGFLRVIGNSADEGFWYTILFIGYPVTFLVNVVTLIALAFQRRSVAYGVLSATALNLFISLVAGGFINGICFVPFFMDF